MVIQLPMEPQLCVAKEQENVSDRTIVSPEVQGGSSEEEETLS